MSKSVNQGTRESISESLKRVGLFLASSLLLSIVVGPTGYILWRAVSKFGLWNTSEGGLYASAFLGAFTVLILQYVYSKYFSGRNEDKAGAYFYIGLLIFLYLMSFALGGL